MKTLIVYVSGKGFIKEAAERVQKALGSHAALLDLKSKSKADLKDYDAVILCGAFRAGMQPRKIKAYARKNEKALLTKKLAFVLGGLDTEEYRLPFEKNFKEELRSHAVAAVHAGGRYIPDDYSGFIRNMMEKINKSSGAVHREKWENLDTVIKAFS
ncbi:MAG: flavodoxin domain-containing protein [Spirochaetales bacterium]|nr:flavodoxin domain-containing protein [Spirochaetales bacterium]